MTKKSAGLYFLLSLTLILCSCAPTTINTIPSGAAVYRGETQIGTTPFDTSVFLAEKNFTVKKDRYFDEPVKLDFDSPRILDLKLRTVPVLVYSKPDATIYPAGSDTAIGQTPMKINVADQAKTYTLKTEDYYDQDISISTESPDPLVVKMERRPIVTISAEPEGVEIYENGKLLGAAPVRIEVLSPRTIELHKAGYFAQGGTLTGAPPYEIHAVLRPFPVITVTASPAGAEISRKGSLIGKNSVKLAVGEPTVLDVRADRFYSQSVTLTPESPVLVSVDLKAMPYVMINSEPAGAEVFIDGKSVGTAPVEQLIEKDTAIELRKEGFVTRTASLTGADKQVTITLEAVPVVQPEVQAEIQSEVQTEAAAPVAAPEAAAAPEKGNSLLWLAGAAVAVIAGLIFFLIKRKKK